MRVEKLSRVRVLEAIRKKLPDTLSRPDFRGREGAHVSRQNGPAVCRLVAGKIMLFDGQHKSAAQIWAGRRVLDCKMYIEPNVRLLKDTKLKRKGSTV